MEDLAKHITSDSHLEIRGISVNSPQFQDAYFLVVMAQIKRLLGEFYEELSHAGGIVGTMLPVIMMQLRRGSLPWH